jgi:hypothetical protein
VVLGGWLMDRRLGVAHAERALAAIKERFTLGRIALWSDRHVFHERPVRPSGQVTPTPHTPGLAAFSIP